MTNAVNMPFGNKMARGTHWIYSYFLIIRRVSLALLPSQMYIKSVSLFSSEYFASRHRTVRTLVGYTTKGEGGPRATLLSLLVKSLFDLFLGMPTALERRNPGALCSCPAGQAPFPRGQ